MSKAIWKDIPGYKGLYQISSLGQVLSKARFDAMGRYVNEKIRRLAADKDGYLQVVLNKNGVKETFLIAAMDGKEQHMGSFGNMKGEKVMSKIIPLLMGSWITFCTMVGDYDGAMAILAVYLLLVVLDPLNKKGTTAANSRTQK